MNKMFCFQCEQTAKCTGCTQIGVCGKTADVANMQDELTSSLITALMYQRHQDSYISTEILLYTD